MRFIDIMTNHCPSTIRSFRDENMHIIEGISNHLENEADVDNAVTPRNELILSAFHLTSFDEGGMFPNSLKVIFMFQDVYYQPGLACGVATCTLNGTAQPTLTNIFKRLSETYPLSEPLNGGDIRGWSAQGVLLWNAAMTTRVNEKEAHIGEWSLFTTRMIKWLSDRFPYLIFVFFGKKAQAYKGFINTSKHKVITTSHPSPLGYHYGFDKSNIFNEINESLITNRREPIQWENYTYI